MQEEKLPITEHLEELRKRLINSLIALGLTSVACYLFAERILSILLKPLLVSLPEGSNLVFVNLTEAFLAYLKVSILAGGIISSPYIFYQIWLFVAPGLYEKEKRAALSFVTFTVLSLLAGISFCYFVILPVIFPFLLSFGKEMILPLPTIKNSVSIIIRLFFIFGLIFEIPLVSFLLARIGLLKGDVLKGARKFIFLISFVVAAIITPPDVVSQIIVGFPLYGIFEISILLARVGEKLHVKPGTSEKPNDEGEETSE